jgi:hypothetical protein
MGYDLTGKNPTGPYVKDEQIGSYFRANISGWSAFRMLLIVTDDKYSSRAWRDKDWAAISSNDGLFVPKSTCVKMAKRIRKTWQVVSDDPVDHVITKLTGVRFKENLPGFGSDYHDYVEEFIQFLEYCGGFNCY